MSGPGGASAGAVEFVRAFEPHSGTVEQWDEAVQRVEDYLRAHRVHRKLAQQRLLHEILNRAAARHQASPSADPVSLSVEEADQVFAQWLESLYHPEALPADRRVPAGKVALVLADGPERVRNLYLDPERVGEDFRGEIHRVAVRTGPDLEVSSMVPRDIDLGPITGVAGAAWERLERLPWLRTALLWALFAGFMVFLFWRTR